MSVYIFLCSKFIEKECLDKNLFGGKISYRSQVASLKKGDTLLLYNYTNGLLHGFFEAVSDPAEDIDPEAWRGQFPFQVKVKRIEKFEPISIHQFQHFVYFRKTFPKAILSNELVSRLKEIFTSPHRLPLMELKYLGENPREYKTNDGHMVRSMGERKIDNYLSDHKILHSYDMLVPIDEPMLYDFYLPEHDIYIEFWGLEDEKYLKRKEKKIALYHSHNLKLLEFTENNLKDIEKIMSQFK